MDVGGCGCLSSSKIRQSALDSFALWNNAPSSALAADAATVCSTVQIKLVVRQCDSFLRKNASDLALDFSAVR